MSAKSDLYRGSVLAVVILTMYIITAFLTYGYTRARRGLSTDEASTAGVFWPLYWFARGFRATGDAAVWLFEESPTPKVEG